MEVSSGWELHSHLADLRTVLQNLEEGLQLEDLGDSIGLVFLRENYVKDLQVRSPSNKGIDEVEFRHVKLDRLQLQLGQGLTLHYCL